MNTSAAPSLTVILSEAKDLNVATHRRVEMLRPECLPGLAFGAQHDRRGGDLELARLLLTQEKR